jgi:ribonucleoside-diphosphate reductase alpha chain
MVSAVFQRGGDVRFVAEELKQIHDPKGGQWVDGRYCPSLVALIGQKLSEHLDNIGYQSTPESLPQETSSLIEVEEDAKQSPDTGHVPDQCPSCKGFSMVDLSGCPTCQDCGYSKCG